ncbi:hypothetical protein COOONC_15305 [Cooperia oncophora]
MRFLSRVSLALLLATATLAQDEEDYDYSDYSGNTDLGGGNGNGNNQGGQVQAPATPAPVVEKTPAPVVEKTPAPVVEKTPAPVVVTTPAPVVVTTTVNPNNMRCPQNSGVNDRIRNAALEGHNYRRSRLAQGLVKNKNDKLLPPATNMLKLAIKYWWSQLRVVGTVGTGVTFRSSQSGSPVSYFTRMAWATTAKFGCAVTQKNKCPNSYYIACHYQIGGNVPDAKIYIPGNACSQCPGDYRCDSNKLCSRS